MFTKIDIACKDPAKVAAFYAALLGHSGQEVGPGMVLFQLEGMALFLCDRMSAGVSAEAEGTHQLHVQTDRSLEELKDQAKSLGCQAQEAQFGPGPTCLSVWDPEGNPVVLIPV